MTKYYKLSEITVTIPTLNEQDNIADCISSIKKSGIKNILVIDGASTDQTLKILKKLNVKFISLKKIGVWHIKECWV